jgi:tRNA (cmo5U34)-methyltransferase
MKKDRVFAHPEKQIKPFEFNEKVTQVFDDMLFRSVPLYQECIARQSQMAYDFYQTGSRIYDLGCSHGNLGLATLNRFEDTSLIMVGVDSSWPMIQKYARRLDGHRSASNVNLVCGLLEHIQIDRASVVLINLTLQFLAPEKRDQLISDIYTGMLPGGVLMLTEKTIHPLPEMDQIEQAFYRQFKRENGYSDLEISQKREALERVLVPDSTQTHFQRLEKAGFSLVDIWLKWFNFSAFMAIK